MTKRTEITIETDQVLVIHRRRRILRTWCAACAEKAEMVTADEAAAAASVELQTVYRWVQTCDVHFTQTPEGLLFVCLNSLRSLPYAADAVPVQSDADLSSERRLDGSAGQVSWPLASADFGDQVSSAVRHLALSTMRTFRRIISGLL